MIVVDASVLVEFLLGNTAAVSLVRSELSANPSQLLHAPELIELETLNALRLMEQRGQVTAAQLAAALQRLKTARLVRWPHTPLRDRVWQLRHNLTAYDASYIALAELLTNPVLITGDGGLEVVAIRELGASAVRRLHP